MGWVVLWYWFSFWCNHGLAPFQIWTYAFPTCSYDFLLEDVRVHVGSTYYPWRLLFAQPAVSRQQTAATSHKKCKESKSNTQRCQDRSQVWYQIRQTNSKGNYSNRNNSNNNNRMSSNSGSNNIYSGYYYFIKYSTISSECHLLFHVTM